MGFAERRGYNPELEPQPIKNNVYQFKPKRKDIGGELNADQQKSDAVLKEQYATFEDAYEALKSLRAQSKSFNGTKDEKIALGNKISELASLIKQSSNSERVKYMMADREASRQDNAGSGEEPPRRLVRKKAGLLAKAALALAGVTGVSLGIGYSAGHKVGFAKGQDSTQIEKIDPKPYPESPISEPESQPEEDSEAYQDNLEGKEIYLAPEILSQEIVEKDNQTFLNITVEQSERIYAAALPMPKRTVSAGLKFEERLDHFADMGTEMFIRTLVAKTSEGELRIELTESMDGLEITVLETDNEGKETYSENYFQTPGTQA
jgi:hypothetical protein